MTRSNNYIRREFFYSLLVVLTSLMPLSSQVLRGTVTQKDTKVPLVSVNVFLQGTKHGTITDSLGQFELKKFPLGVYIVEVRRVGYRTNRYVFNAERDELINLVVEMEVDPVVVGGVVVSGQAEMAKQLSNFGKTIITSEQIKHTGTKSLSTFLKSQYPGLFPSYTRRTYERLHFILYLNGALVQYTADVLDSMIDVDQVDYIEVYRSFGMTSSRDRGSNERVIHIHTKIPQLGQ